MRLWLPALSAHTPWVHLVSTVRGIGSRTRIQDLCNTDGTSKGQVVQQDTWCWGMLQKAAVKVPLPCCSRIQGTVVLYCVK